MRRLLSIVIVTYLALLDPASGSTSCPVRQYSGGCIQVITYAVNPTTGDCCVYPNPCSVPEGWEMSTEGCPRRNYCYDSCSPYGETGTCYLRDTGKRYNCICEGTWDCFLET